MDQTTVVSMNAFMDGRKVCTVSKVCLVCAERVDYEPSTKQATIPAGASCLLSVTRTAYCMCAPRLEAYTVVCLFFLVGRLLRTQTKARFKSCAPTARNVWYKIRWIVAPRDTGL